MSLNRFKGKNTQGYLAKFLGSIGQEIWCLTFHICQNPTDFGWRPAPAKRVCTSFGSRTRNYLAAVPTVDSKILVGRENEGIGKHFSHANQASIGESHRNVGILLDQFHDWLHVLGKCEGDEQGAAAK